MGRLQSGEFRSVQVGEFHLTVHELHNCACWFVLPRARTPTESCCLQGIDVTGLPTPPAARPAPAAASKPSPPPAGAEICCCCLIGCHHTHEFPQVGVAGWWRGTRLSIADSPSLLSTLTALLPGVNRWADWGLANSDPSKRVRRQREGHNRHGCAFLSQCPAASASRLLNDCSFSSKQPACCVPVNVPGLMQGIDVTGLPNTPAARAPAPTPAPAAAAPAVAAAPAPAPASSAAAQPAPVPYSQRKSSAQPAPLGALAKMPPSRKPAAPAAPAAPASQPAAAAAPAPAAASKAAAPSAAPAGVNRWADWSLANNDPAKRVRRLGARGFC